MSQTASVAAVAALGTSAAANDDPGETRESGTQQRKGGGEGILIHGPDGAYYHISDDQLQTFRLPEDKAAQLRLAHRPDHVPIIANVRGQVIRRTGLAASEAVTQTCLNIHALRQVR